MGPLKILVGHYYFYYILFLQPFFMFNALRKFPEIHLRRSLTETMTAGFASGHLSILAAYKLVLLSASVTCSVCSCALASRQI